MVAFCEVGATLGATSTTFFATKGDRPSHFGKITGSSPWYTISVAKREPEKENFHVYLP